MLKDKVSLFAVTMEIVFIVASHTMPFVWCSFEAGEQQTIVRAAKMMDVFFMYVVFDSIKQILYQ
ncbi:hypothetical protein GCM10007042_33530 [Butyricimonas paravirosa]|nr:hypothetical protein GCM10007042_33530 [Butyricimonas paravirosa]